MARLFGGHVIAADISEEKLALARQWGADQVINAKTDNIAETVMELTAGRGVQAAIDFNGAPETFEAAIASLATSGTAVLVGGKMGEITFPHTQLILSEKTITGTRYSTKKELAESFALMASGDIKPVVGRRVHFTELELLFEELANETLLGRGALTYDE